MALSRIQNNSYEDTAVHGVRNLIINGEMQVAQRGTSAVTAGNNYAVDRFRTDFSTDGAFSLERSITTPADFKNSVKWTTTTADTSLASTQYAYFRQRIEGNAMSHLNWGSSDAKTITLSFYIRSSVTGTFGGAVWNDAFNRSYAFSYTISSADTWERKAITIPGDTSGTWLTDNSCGMNLTVLASAGSTYQGTAGVWAGVGNVTAAGTVNIMNTLNSTYFVTGVQLEVGDTATPFEHRSYGDELARCQRYYEKITVPQYTNFVAVNNQFNSAMHAQFQYNVIKRTDPSVSVNKTEYSYYNVYNGSNGTGTLSASGESNENMAALEWGGSIGAYSVHWVYLNTGSENYDGVISADAEL